MTRVPFYKAGPVYLNGEHVLTFTRDVYEGDVTSPSDAIRPDGTQPEQGGLMTLAEEAVIFGHLGEQPESVK